LHSKHVNQNSLEEGEEALSSALLDVLLGDPKNGYYMSKALIGIIQSLIHAQDIVGAFLFMEAADSYIARSLAHDGILYAEYRFLVGQLFAFIGDYAQATAILSEAAQLTGLLEIDDEVKSYRLAIANSLASAALLLAGKGQDAQELHSKHPMQKVKERILSDGELHTYQEFFFGVSDVLASRALKLIPDLRWRPLFERDPKWNIGELETTNINSYRHFVIGLLDVADSEIAKGQRELMIAAKERIDIFDAVMRVNSEGFQLPSLVDRIVLLVGAEAATELKPPNTADLLLRIRACIQLRRIVTAANCTPARKFLASLS
jgi:hypothetical protein